MKNKKIIWLGTGIAAAVGISGMFIYQGSNSKEVETMAMAEQAEEPVKESIEEPEEQLSEKTVETAETKGREKKLGGAVEETVVKAVELMVNTYETYARGEMAGTETEEADETANGNETEEAELTTENGITVNSTSDDVILGDDEYKGDNPLDTGKLPEQEYDPFPDVDDEAIVEEILKELEEEHPEWFEDNNNDGNGGYTQGYDPADWEGIGTPDNTANTRQFTYDDFNSATSDVPAGTVY